MKVAGHLAENTPGKLIGIIPALPAGPYKVRVVTQFSSGSFMLKEPRIIEI